MDIYLLTLHVRSLVLILIFAYNSEQVSVFQYFISDLFYVNFEFKALVLFLTRSKYQVMINLQKVTLL